MIHVNNACLITIPFKSDKDEGMYHVYDGQLISRVRARPEALGLLGLAELL